MGYLQTLDGAFLNTQQYQSAVSFNKEYNTRQEIELDGNVFQNGYWIRPFETTYKGATGYVPIYLEVIGDDNIGYEVHTTGIITEPIMSDLAYDISFGLGAKWDKDSDDYMQMVYEIGNTFANIPTVIVNDTRYVVDALVEWINQYIIDKYGDVPVDSKYYIEQKVYPNGENNIEITEHKNIANTMGACFQNTTGSASLNADIIHEDLQNMIDEGDADLLNVLSKAVVRTGRHTYNGSDDFLIYGYDIENNTVVTSTQSGKNQYHTGIITHYYVVSYIVEGGHLVKHASYNGAERRTETFYNYPRYGSKLGGTTLYARLPNGIQNTTDAVTEFDMLMDSIGASGKEKPYHNLPNGGLWNKQPNNTYKVGYPDPEEDEDQDPVRNGDPVPVNVIFRPHYIIGVPPTPEPDPYRIVPWDRDEKTPDVDTDSFYNVFEVNQTMLNSLNNALWDTSALEEIKRAFTNNPLDAIISLHQVYYRPVWQEIESGFEYRSIHLGAYNTHVQAPIIPKRYQKLVYNGIPVNKQFENIRDFQRDLTIYLPFIGFRQLDITDICGNVAYSTIYIEYTVDNLTGDCVAVIYVNKDGNTDKKPLYIFNGNCSSQLPLTGADRSGLLSASLSAIGGVASTVLTGGATAPSLIGNALNIANNMGMSIDRSGNITGNHGAMLFKNPFLIINYPIPFDAENFTHYGGGSSNVTTTLKYCQGFTKMSECILDSIPCTSQEKASIQSMLASGIII